MAKSLCLVLFSLILATGCERSGTKDLDYLNSQLKKLLQEAGQQIDGLAPGTKEVTESTSQELEKLFIYEYKVAEFRKDAAAAELEAGLQQLGQDRWECFASDRSDKGLRFFCRRRPKTYLRYIPRLVP